MTTGETTDRGDFIRVHRACWREFEARVCSAADAMQLVIERAVRLSDAELLTALEALNSRVIDVVLRAHSVTQSCDAELEPKP